MYSLIIEIFKHTPHLFGSFKLFKKCNYYLGVFEISFRFEGRFKYELFYTLKLQRINIYFVRIVLYVRSVFMMYKYYERTVLINSFHFSNELQA